MTQAADISQSPAQRRARSSKRLITTALVALLLGTTGVATAGAANNGRLPATQNDAWIQCGYTSVTFMMPGYASPVRRSQFAYSLNSGAYQNTQWFFFSGSLNYYFDASAGWVGFGNSATLSHVAGGTVVRAWEFRLYANGAGAWDYLGACTVEVNPLDGGGYVWDYQSLR